jgi:iron complex outermembrane receptor protein
VGGGAERHLRADYRAWYDGEAYFTGDFPFSNLSGYVQHEAALSSSLTLTLGVRHDRRSDAQPTTSPRAALLYSPSERRTVKLLYGEAFREPSVYERHYEDTDFIPWPSLGREHVSTLEAVWEERFGSWLRGEVSVFYYDLSGLIDTTLDEESGKLHFENRASVTAPGAEAELEARLPSGAALYANYAYQRARDGATDERLTNSPAHLLKLGGSSPLTARASVMAELRWESARGTVYGGTTDAYALARAGVRVSPLARLDAWLTIENLFDARYATPGGFEHLQPSIQQDGRTLRAGLGYRF